MRKVILVCDQCGKQQPEDEAVNWHQIDVAGIDASLIGDRGLRGLYCSHTCVFMRLDVHTIRGGGGVAEGRRREA